MKKKSKRVSMTVAAVMLALSVSYFALLAPTTAWFYQDQTDTYAFTFGDFDLNQTPQSTNIIAQRLSFAGATRFADTGEVLFDEVAHVIEVDVENAGDLPAKLTVSVSDKVGATTYGNVGLKWCVIGDTVSSFPEESSAEYTSTVEKGDIKSAIEDMLTSEMALHDYGDFDDPDADVVESEYESYNVTAKQILSDNNNTPLLFPGNGITGSLKKVYVVFWVEFGDVRDEMLSESTTTLSDYGVSVQLTATPNVDSGDLTIENNYAGSATVVLKLGDTEYNGAYTVDGKTLIADNGEITLASGKTAVVNDIAVSTYYTITPSSGSYECSNAYGTIDSDGVSAEITAA